MADIKFSCPHCQQHISADSGYGGMQINCPSCNGALTVPGAPSPPAPVRMQAAAPPPSAPTPSTTPRSGSSGCPSCGAALPRGAMLCTQCGYNLSTGQRMVAGKPAAKGKPKTDQWDTPWYKTAYPYIGGVILILGILYYLGRENQIMKAGFVLVLGLYVVTVHIIVAVSAFREGIGMGFLTLCVPFFALYYVFKINDDDTLKLLYGFAILANISLRFIDLK